MKILYGLFWLLSYTEPYLVFLAARLAPHKPLKHAIALGIVGIILSVMGLIIMWDVPPRWYSISLIVLTMPSVGIGGKLAMKSKR
jgi:hypothetical protein